MLVYVWYPQTSRLQLSVRLDVSAPHIIIPEDVRNRDTRMVRIIIVTRNFMCGIQS